MVSASGVRFWTHLEMTEDDALRYTAAVLPEFLAAGGSALPSAVQEQALCYLIASKVENAEGSSGKKSESLGGYSYTRTDSTHSGRWLDLYYELLHPFTSAAEQAKGGIVPRTDRTVVRMNRSFRYGRIF